MIKIRNGNMSDIGRIYDHLSIQSILDIKMMFGQITLSDIQNAAQKSDGFFIADDGKYPYAMIMLTSAEDGSKNAAIWTTGIFNSAKDECTKAMEEFFSKMKGETIRSKIFNCNRQGIRLYAMCGFAPIKETQKYKVLEYGY
ncbi:MAG: hypothetical protein LBF28_03320 [Rickettsiales bacterium]|jgi:hypothetical protein|nr:hypothetical protein [Rickettsiales bacterium]